MTGGAQPLPAASIPDAHAEPRRYRALQVGSLGMIAAGLVVTLAVLQTTPGILSESVGDETAGRAVAVLAWVVAGGTALLVGLLAHAARSVVVRDALPASRYRGPSILVMLVLAVVAANLAIIPAASEVAALLSGDEMSPLATLAILTVTQLALLGTAALYVLAPRALAGVRLLPERRLLRSIAVGLALAVPAWIGAQLIGIVVVWLLEQVGFAPDVGVAEQALANADPVILVVALVIVAPIAEEIFFRGVVYNAWLREYGARRAVIGSAILFGFIHGSVFLFLPIVALGILLVGVYRATGSLPAAIALHAGFNGITVLLGLLARYGVFDLPVT